MSIACKGRNPSDFFSAYPDSMKLTVNKLCSNSDALLLLDSIKKQLGKISIQIGDCNDQKALWSWKDKRITLSHTLSCSNLKAYCLFELYNASQTTDFERVAKEAESVAVLVEKFERLEHQSALKTQEMTRKIFDPKLCSDFDYTFREFSLHYALQQVLGHSGNIAKKYFPNQRYRGTFCYSLSELTSKEKELLYSLLYLYLRRGDQKNSESKKVSFETFFAALKKLSKTDLQYEKVIKSASILFKKAS